MAPCPGVIGSKCVSFWGVVWVKRQKTQIWAEVPVEISHLQSWLKTRSQKGVVPSIQTERERGWVPGLLRGSLGQEKMVGDQKLKDRLE